MLKVSELREFVNLAKADNDQITGDLITASEDRYTRYARKIRHEDDDVYLIALLPGARPIGNNEDNLRFANSLSFMIIRKLDTTAGDEMYEQAFSVTQDAALKFVDLIVKQIEAFPAHCVFKYFELSTLQILPVENFHQTNGWDISITLKTNFIT